MLSPFAHRLNTNYVPSDDEIAVIRGVINEGESVLKATEGKMEELKRELRALAERWEAEKREVDEHKALLSPIKRINYDILSSIFLIVLDLVNHQHLDISTKHPAVVISHVCQRWRETALSIKLLWRHVHLQIPRYPLFPGYRDTWRAEVSKLVELTEMWISRSDDCHLSVRIHEPLSTAWAGDSEGETGAFVTECIEFHKLVEALCSSSPRWKDMDLRISFPQARFPNFPTIRLLTDPPQSTPTLTDVKLNCDVDELQQDRPASQHLVSSTNIFSAPTLRSLKIRGSGILAHDIPRMPVVWSHLEHLVIRGSSGNSLKLFDAVKALELLKECPNLATCYLLLEKDTVIPIHRAPIPLPRLEELNLEPYPCHFSKGFATSLVLPSLRKLNIFAGGRCSPREHRESGLFEFLECFGSSLEEVSFCYESLTQAGLHYSLRLLPKVTSLWLRSPYRFRDNRVGNGSGLVPASLNRDIFTDLTPQFDAARPSITQSPLCPSLEVLTLSAGQRGLAEDALFDLIAARRREANNQPPRLRQVACRDHVFTDTDLEKILRERGVDMKAFSITRR